MPTHVPEDEKKTVPTREEQLLALREMLAGREAFKRVRGTFGEEVIHRVEYYLCDSTPTEALRIFDQDVADMRIMVNLLAKFRRDGWLDAANELKHVLRTRDALLTGETLDAGKTTPMTLLTFNTEDALWMLSEHAVAEPPIDRVRHAPEVVAPMVLKARVWGFALLNRDGTCRVPDRFGPMPSQIFGQYQQNGFQTAFLIREPQKKVLARFTRNVQVNLATWAVDVDTEHLPYTFYVGLHPESHHAYWQKMRPANASHGVSHGHGVTVFGDLHQFDAYMKREPEAILLASDQPHHTSWNCRDRP